MTQTPEDKYQGERCYPVAPDVFQQLYVSLRPEARFTDPELLVDNLLLLRGGNRIACFYEA